MTRSKGHAQRTPLQDSALGIVCSRGFRIDLLQGFDGASDPLGPVGLIG